jgi:hypothetical protein
MDSALRGWDRRPVTAATLRRSPVTGLAVVRALVALLAALVVGGAVVVVVSGASWWAAVAGGFACASGLVFGATRRSGVAGGLALVAAVAVVVAADAGGAGGRRAAVAAYPAPELAPERDPRAGVVIHGPSRPTDDRTMGDARDRSAAGGARGPSPARLVRDYYAALDRGRFALAWRRLAPGVRVAFGGFEAWRLGYGSTLGHRVEGVAVERSGGGATVRHDLVAVDRTPCGGTTERRFAVGWRLERGRATSLSAVKLAGLDPADSC